MFKTRYTIFVCLGLMVAILAVYSQVINCEFTNFDDNTYVYGNSQIKSGITSKAVIWAFATTHSANWHPLTWLSHMVDVEFFGLEAGGHHLSNVLFHIANTLLLFILFVEHFFRDVGVDGLRTLHEAAQPKRLWAGAVVFYAGVDGQAHVGDPAVCTVAAGLLAPGPH